jgi:hypothetical protein
MNQQILVRGFFFRRLVDIAKPCAAQSAMPEQRRCRPNSIASAVHMVPRELHAAVDG